MIIPVETDNCCSETRMKNNRQPNPVKNRSIHEPENSPWMKHCLAQRILKPKGKGIRQRKGDMGRYPETAIGLTGTWLDGFTERHAPEHGWTSVEYGRAMRDGKERLTRFVQGHFVLLFFLVRWSSRSWIQSEEEGRENCEGERVTGEMNFRKMWWWSLGR